MNHVASTAEGRATKTRLFGDTPSASGTKLDSHVAPLIAEISDRVLWGTIWSRDTLDLRTRCLCTITALMGLQRYEYARLHVVGAKNLGVTREELDELMVQLTFYAGMPVVHTGLQMVQDVFAESA